MIIKFDRQKLAKALQIVSKTVSSRTAMPILSGILMRSVDRDTVELIASDGITSIRTRCDAGIIEPGNTVFSARNLVDIVKTMPSDQVTIEQEIGSSAIKISGGTAEFNLNTMPAEDYPPLASVENENRLSINMDTFRNMVKQVSVAVSNNEARPVYTGILLKAENSNLIMVATDTHRLAVRKEPVDIKHESVQRAIIPGKMMQEAARLSVEAQDDDDIGIWSDEKQVAIEAGETVLISRLLEGQYPDFTSVIPSEFSTNVIVENSVFLAALERASLVAAQAAPTVRLEIRKGEIQVESHSPEFGRSCETITAETAGEDLIIAFNAHYLTDALKAISDEKVGINFNDSLSPAILKSLGTSEYTYLVLPVRLRAEF